MLRKLIIGVAVVLALVFGFAASTHCGVTDLKNNQVFVHDYIEGNDGVWFYEYTSGEGDYHIYIDTPGGSARQTIRMMDRIMELRRNGATVTTECISDCYSGGSYIWMLGDVRIASKEDLFMFHEVVMVDPKTKEIVPDKDLTKEQINNRNYTNSLLRTKFLKEIKSTKIVNKLLNPKGNRNDGTNQNWFTGQELFEMGLVHKLI